jgi:hypothetical protein
MSKGFSKGEDESRAQRRAIQDARQERGLCRTCGSRDKEAQYMWCSNCVDEYLRTGKPIRK